MEEYIVIQTPWNGRLPNGTQIIKVSTPKGYKGNWFKRKDLKLIFPETENSLDKEGVFKLFDHEYRLLDR